MPLAPGVRLGSYEVAAKISAKAAWARSIEPPPWQVSDGEGSANEGLTCPRR